MADERALQGLFDWMRRQPAGLQQAMLRFPPSCYVKSKDGISLSVPADGETGQVTKYREKPDGRYTLVVMADENRGECELDWVEVYDCHNGLTPEVVAMVCGLEGA